jgi:hypothetical protein
MEDAAISICLETSISSKEARSRGIALGKWRLIVGFAETATALHAMADLIVSHRPIGKEVFIGAINEFISLTELSSLDQSGSEHFRGAGLLMARDKDDVERALEKWKAEMLVLFFARPGDVETLNLGRVDSEAKWWKFSRRNPDTAYADQLREYDPIIFYSGTRAALEFIGTEATTLAYFDAVRTSLKHNRT